MFKFILKLLKGYLNTEANRLKVYAVLKEAVETEYNEQTKYGNVYNAFIEFLMADEFVKECVETDLSDSINVIKQGIGNSYYQAIDFIKGDLKRQAVKRQKK